MDGKEFLDFLIGTTSQIGVLDKNIDDTEYRAFMLQCLNLTLKDISTRQDGWHFRFLEKTGTTTTVASQIDYDLPADIDGVKVFSVWDRTHNNTYTFKEHDLFLRLVPNPSLRTGNPLWYTIWGNLLKLYPIPSSAFTLYIRYIKTITLLTDSDTSNTDVPTKFDQVIIDGALKWAYKFDKQLGDESLQTQIYEAGVQRIVTENLSNINDLAQTESHRTRGSSRVSFPVDQ